MSTNPHHWLVLYNYDDADSLAWVEAYRAARGVPYSNLLGLRNVPATETIDESTWLAMRDAVASFIARNRMSHIRGILLGHNLPAVASIEGALYAISSLLADLGGTQVNAANPSFLPGLVTIADLPARSSLPSPGKYLVSGITAPTLAEAIAMTTRAEALSTVAADGALISQMTAERDHLHAPHTSGAWPALDAWRASAERGRVCLPTEDADAASLGQTICLSASGTGSFAPSDELRGLWISIANSAGVSVRDGASLMRSAIEAGYAFVLAPVDDAQAGDLPNPSALLSVLRAGGTWAEAIAAALPLLGGRFRAIGDPLWGLPTPRAGFGVYREDDDSLVAIAADSAAPTAHAGGRLGPGEWPLVIRRCDAYGTHSPDLRCDVWAQSHGGLLPAMRRVQAVRAVAAAGGMVVLHWAIEPPVYGRALPDRFEIAHAHSPQTVLATVPAAAAEYVYQAQLGPFSHGQSVALAVRGVRDAQDQPGLWRQAAAVIARAQGPAAPPVVA